MGNTRKSYAYIYLMDNTPEEDMKSIEKILKYHDIEPEEINSRDSYLDWLRNPNSINPSLFITNGILAINEVSSVYEKLEGAVLILIGNIQGIKEFKYPQRPEGKENLLKRYDNHEGLMGYLKIAFSSKPFKDKVIGNNSDDTNAVTPLAKEETIKKNTEVISNKSPVTPTVSAPKQEEKGVVETPKVIVSPTEVVIHQTELSTPIFPEDDEDEEARLKEQLKTITEVANKTKAIKVDVPVTPSLEPNETAPSTEKAIVYSDNPYHQRSRHLQKQVFAQRKWENNRTIGVWSPLHRMGVTSFTINFALFLAENRVYTAVLEGLTEQHSLKNWLQRYSSIPTNWSSYAKAIHSDGHTNEIKWKYRDVIFLPLDTEDPQFEWNAFSLESYMTTTKDMDITLVDFPTGKMTKYTEDSLHYVNELWILIDDAAQETLAWKKYIQTIQEKVQIPVYLLFNKTYDFSQEKRISKEYGLPLLTKLPALHEETMRNYYESIPLYNKKEVQEKLLGSFTELGKHLLGKDFEVNDKMQNVQKNKWPSKFLNRLKLN